MSVCRRGQGLAVALSRACLCRARRGDGKRGRHVHGDGSPRGRVLGRLLNGKPHGYGLCLRDALLWDNNPASVGAIIARREGHWRNGLMHGYGMHVCADGVTYRGDWVDDMYHGRGVRTHPDGRIVYRGEWERTVHAAMASATMATAGATRASGQRGCPKAMEVLPMATWMMATTTPVPAWAMLSRPTEACFARAPTMDTAWPCAGVAPALRASGPTVLPTATASTRTHAGGPSMAPLRMACRRGMPCASTPTAPWAADSFTMACRTDAALCFTPMAPRTRVSFTTACPRTMEKTWTTRKMPTSPPSSPYP
ncbi:morn repeat incomplete domain containing protein [Pandoravirus celtis]|uniref:Morn repeat incomplete domain containing protein n=1 Tax=Pandoravirus celtis TaxID=2568002 RepID=A0A4D6EL46_9VIRU|nr:morn repeat incomplete domain containing protein [Pandoravirus celtis]